MKTIKSLFGPLLLTAVLLPALQQCSSQKYALIDNPPFTLGEVMSEDWSSGDQTGINLFVPIEDGKDIMLEQVWFRGRMIAPEKMQRDSYLVYIARFRNTTSQDEDMILHGDPKKEFGNKPPKLNKKFPFELEDNQAVVQFTENGKTKYYKIETIKESVPVVDPPKKQ